jgi:hypothetical protein
MSEEKFRVENNRTIIFFSHFPDRIKQDDFSGLEKDLQKEDLCDETRAAIKNQIGEKASAFLDNIGVYLGIDRLFIKTNQEKPAYYGSFGKGIDIYLKNTIINCPAKGRDYLSVPSIANLQIAESGESVSVQLGFGGIINKAPLSHLLKIHSSVKGYQLSSGKMDGLGRNVLIINPVQKSLEFIEGIKWAQYLLDESGIEDELFQLQRDKRDNIILDYVAKGQYALGLFKVLEIKIEN